IDSGCAADRWRWRRRRWRRLRTRWSDGCAAGNLHRQADRGGEELFAVSHRKNGSAKQIARTRMHFTFDVGFHEQHIVPFSFDQFVGNLEIKVDGEPLVKDFRMFSLKLTKRYEFTVGQNEQHQVAIEKKRKLFLAGLRPQQYKVFIDGQLVQTYEGS